MGQNAGANCSTVRLQIICQLLFLPKVKAGELNAVQSVAYLHSETYPGNSQAVGLTWFDKALQIPHSRRN